jgi:hypothetical protein
MSGEIDPVLAWKLKHGYVPPTRWSQARRCAHA